MTFGQKLKDLRTVNGITQKELSAMLHVSFQTVSKWENDLNEPDLATLKQLAKIFGCSLDRLTDFEEEEIRKTGGKKSKYREVYKTNLANSRFVSDRDNGYIDGVKTISSTFYEMNVGFDKQQKEKYSFSKEIRIQSDSLVYFFIDDNNSLFGFFFNRAPQFVCPFENYSSYELTSFSDEATYSDESISKNLPKTYVLTIHYFNKNGEPDDYIIKFDCSRIYILHNGTIKSVEDAKLIENKLSKDTQNNLEKVISSLNSIKRTKLPKDLPNTPIEMYKKDGETAREYSKQYQMSLQNVMKHEKMSLKTSVGLFIVVGLTAAVIVGFVFLFVFVFYKR